MESHSVPLYGRPRGRGRLLIYSACVYVLCVRHYGNNSEETGIPDATSEASSQTCSKEDRVFGRRQELERGEDKQRCRLILNLATLLT